MFDRTLEPPLCRGALVFHYCHFFFLINRLQLKIGDLSQINIDCGEACFRQLDTSKVSSVLISKMSRVRGHIVNSDTNTCPFEHLNQLWSSEVCMFLSIMQHKRAILTAFIPFQLMILAHLKALKKQKILRQSSR